MPTDLEQQLARFAEGLDREAPPISFPDVVGRGTVAVDDDLLEPPHSRVDGLADEIVEPDVIDLAPAVVSRRPTWPRAALKVAVAAAAVAVLVVALAAIERGSDGSDPADDFPDLTTTFVSPRNGFSVNYFDSGEGTVTPAKQLLRFPEKTDDGFDVVETGLGAVFKAASMDVPPSTDRAPGVSLEQWVEEYLSNDLPGGCGVPRSEQAGLTIDGRSGRVAECANRIEASVLVGSRLYLFTLTHDRSDARAVFDAFVATIDLTPQTAVDFPAMTTTFVSPTNGFSFKFHDRGGLAPATELWDPSDQPLDLLSFDGRFDGVETGLLAYFEGASTEIPDGVSIDAWVDEYVTPTTTGGCGVPRSQQAEITIDGQPGRTAACDHSEATVVAGGRLYLFIGPSAGDLGTNTARRNTAWFDAWIATIDLTPETAAVP